MFVVPVPRILFQSSERVVGETQDIICSVTINSAIDRNSVELTWTNNDSNITTDNRVTIIPTIITDNSSSFTYTTTIQFAYLMEGDEGNYTCKVTVDNMTESRSVTLQNLISTYVCMFTYLLNTLIYMYALFIYSTQSCCRGYQY